jgi:hypothetical protein
VVNKKVIFMDLSQLSLIYPKKNKGANN